MTDHAEAEQRVNSLAAGIFGTEAVYNSFFRLWCQQQLQPVELTGVAVNLYQHLAPTLRRIVALFSNINDGAMRHYLLRILNDEAGLAEGIPHVRLLENFLNTLLTMVSATPCQVTAYLDQGYETESTRTLVHDGYKLFAQPNTMTALGALLAQEWHAYPQLVYLYEGARNYQLQFATLEQFHDACEYFYIHLGRTEKEHREQTSTLAASRVHTSSDWLALQEGFYAYSDLLINYWNSLTRAIEKGCWSEQ